MSKCSLRTERIRAEYIHREGREPGGEVARELFCFAFYNHWQSICSQSELSWEGKEKGKGRIEEK